MGGLLAGLGWEMAVAAGAGMVALIALVGGARSLLVGGRDEVVERLERTAGSRSSTAEPVGGSLSGLLAKFLRPLSRLARPTRADEMSRLRRDMQRGGYRGDHAVEIFLGIKLVLAPVVTLTFLQVNGSLAKPIAFPLDAAIAVWICAVSFWLPNMWLKSQIEKRQTAMERSLPDAMDLLVTCVEAGLGIDSGLHKVAEEMNLASPILASELEQTFLEVQAGVPRADGFRRLAERTGVEDLKQLSAMLIQTEMFGTSVARALRVHSDGMRVKRMQRAEEKAAMVSVKMTIPLVLCILPSLVAIVMGPAVITISKAFGGK